MGTDLMSGALRWVFWGILYLSVVLMAVVLFWGTMAPYLPMWLRSLMLGTFLYGIALDAQGKARRRPPTNLPPSGGHPASADHRS